MDAGRGQCYLTVPLQLPVEAFHSPEHLPLHLPACCDPVATIFPWGSSAGRCRGRCRGCVQTSFRHHGEGLLLPLRGTRPTVVWNDEKPPPPCSVGAGKTAPHKGQGDLHLVGPSVELGPSFALKLLGGGDLERVTSII